MTTNMTTTDVLLWTRLQNAIYDMTEDDNIWDILRDDFGFESGRCDCDCCREDCDCCREDSEVEDSEVEIVEGSSMDIYDWQLLHHGALKYWEEQYTTHGNSYHALISLPADKYIPVDPHPLQLVMYEYWRRHDLYEADLKRIMKKYALNPSVLWNIECPEIEYPASINYNDDGGCLMYLRTGDDPLPIEDNYSKGHATPVWAGQNIKIM